MKQILTVIGTRPEAIKMAPVLERLQSLADFDSRLCVSAQHRQMLDQFLPLFDIEPHYDFNLMCANQDLAGFSASLMTHLNHLLHQYRPDLVLVQGDTSTALIAGLTASYHQTPVAHVEAGLRTYNRLSPWPEEINRTLLADLACMHFAPTESAAEQLKKEGITEPSIHITGNPVIDTLLKTHQKIQHDPELKQRLASHFTYLNPDQPTILITGHRRESFGEGLHQICQAIRHLAQQEAVQFVYPVHLNPNVQQTISYWLSGYDNIHLVEPLDYPHFVYLMSQSDLILTDSGGIQEEAPSLGKPVLVTREFTERTEAVQAGTVRLVGRDADCIIHHVLSLLRDPAQYQIMSQRHNPYGDGRAAERIIEQVQHYVS